MRKRSEVQTSAPARTSTPEPAHPAQPGPAAQDNDAADPWDAEPTGGSVAGTQSNPTGGSTAGTPANRPGHAGHGLTGPVEPRTTGGSDAGTSKRAVGDQVAPQDPRRREIGDYGRWLAPKGGINIGVTWGMEKYSPASYQTFDVGPYELTVRVEEGQCVQDEMDKAHALLADLAHRQFEIKSRQFCEQLIAVAREAKVPR